MIATSLIFLPQHIHTPEEGGHDVMRACVPVCVCVCLFDSCPSALTVNILKVKWAQTLLCMLTLVPNKQCHKHVGVIIDNRTT